MKRLASAVIGFLVFVLAHGLANGSESPQSEFTITAVVQGQGFVDPTSIKVPAGGSAEFLALAEPGWQLESVTGNTCHPAFDGTGLWTVTDVQADCQIQFEFVEQALADVEICSEPNLLIPDEDPAGIDDSLEVDTVGEIVEVRVALLGEHTWVGDLGFKLTHPDQAATVELVDRPGVPASSFGCSNADFDLVLSDDGVDGPVNDQCGPSPALFGNPTPEQPLDGFAGLDLSGTWTLNVSDSAFGDIGRLQRWCLAVSYLPEPVYVVTPLAGTGGAIIPDSPQSVLSGQTASFEIRPDPGFEIDEVSGSCGGSLEGEEYTTEAVFADCTVEASFSMLLYQVTTAVGAGQGNVSPAEQTITHGGAATVTVSPDSGWRIDDVRGDTCTPLALGDNQFEAVNIMADCLITADFERITFEVTPTTQGGGGSIAPDKPQTVAEGETVTFTLQPSENFEVDEVTGSCGGSLSGNDYTTDPVLADCSVVASFRFVETFTVTPAVSGNGGSIEPATPQTVSTGQTITFELLPEPGYQVDQVDGSCGGDLVGMTFTTAAVSSNCDVVASFRLVDDPLFLDRFETAP